MSRFHSLLRQLMEEVALISFTLRDACRSFAPHAQELTSKIRSRIEYLIPNYNVTVLI